MTTAELQDFATRYTAAWCSQNPASVAAFFSPQAPLTSTTAHPPRDATPSQQPPSFS